MRERAFLVWILLAVTCLSFKTALAEDPVYFADANLKAAVEAALGKTDPTPTDMLGLTRLYASGREIVDLTGLGYAANLEYLELDGNQISDLAVLPSLTSLTYLALSDNQISDLSPLASMTYLPALALANNNISDVSAISGLTNLYFLSLGGNQIGDVSSLSRMTNLQQLYLWDNQITELSPLSGMTNLQYLDLFNNQIRDISPLAGLSALKWLGLQKNQISDLSAVSHLMNLSHLDLADNQISDLPVLASLTNLQFLWLRDNNISDISAISGLSKLTQLYLESNQISDVSPLLGLTKLSFLWLDSNPLDRDAYCHHLHTIKNSNPSLYSLGYSSNANPPGGVSATDGMHENRVTVTWDGLCPGPTRYDTFQYMVHRSTSLGGAKQAVSGWLDGTSFDDTTADPGGHYYYWIKSDNTVEFSDPDEGWRGATTQCTLTVSMTAGGTVSTPGIGAFQYDQATSVPVVAAPAVNYHFVSWTGTAVTAGKVDNPSSASTTVTMDADYTLQANFALNTYTLTVNAVNGTVTATPDKTSYTHGETVTLEAVPNTGYHFASWSGDLTGTDNPTTVTMDGDKTVTANFFIIQRTLIISSTPGGAVTSPGEGTFQYDHGTQVMLQAEPDPLFVFAGWRGSVFSSRNPLTLTMENDCQVRAQFVSVLDVLHVDDDAPSDPGPDDPNVSDPNENGTAEDPFDSIQEAIEVAKEGARVVVRSGTYRESIDLLGKSITVSGLDDDPNDPNIADLPIIDAQDRDTVVKCVQGKDPNTILRGLVITGGKAQVAGGILCAGSSPTILNCLIVGNRATGLNAGGGIHCEDSNAVFINCTVSGNCGGSAGAGICFSRSNAMLVNSIVWENVPSQVRLFGSDHSVVAHTDVAGGWPGTANLDADPRFALPGYWADPADLTKVLPATEPTAVWLPGDYHLQSQAGRWEPLTKAWVIDAVTSPCIDAGDPNTPTGKEPLPNGGRINLGAYGGTNQASLSPEGKIVGGN